MAQVLFRRVRGRKTHPNWSGIAKEVEKTLDTKVKPKLIEYHERIVRPWSGEKPTFKARKQVTKGAIKVYVYPTGNEKGVNKWRWLVEGTGLYGPRHRAYPIRPKKAGGVLAFPSAYAPRTRPGMGGQYGGPGKSSGPTIFAKKVVHPGIKPRPFPKIIARWAKPWFTKEMENAMRRAARRA